MRICHVATFRAADCRLPILIVLGVVLYGVSKIVTAAANNTAASAPQTTDEAGRAL
jgi:hypothetical protein